MTLLSSKMLFPVIDSDPLAFLAHSFFKGVPFRPTETTGRSLEGRQAFLPPSRIEATDIMRHLHQLGRRQCFEIFDDGFQNAHSKIELRRFPQLWQLSPACG